MKKQILVLGSLNIDLVQPVERLARAGETLSGSDLGIYVGGKGANQACAAALLGGQVAMAGMVGNDVFGGRLTGELQTAGVNTGAVRRVDTASGSAIIFVLPHGENSIVISPGANGKVTEEFAAEAAGRLRDGDLLLCQLEIPLPSVVAAMKEAFRRGATTMLDPAPAQALSPELLEVVSILTPNQTEAALLTGTAEPPETADEAAVVAKTLRMRGAHTVIVKLGAGGCLIADGSETAWERSFPVSAIDTTAAGDTFNGALAARLAEGSTLREAARFANAAGALAVTKRGAISSIPKRREVDDFLAATRGRGES